jgi:hypothetical protein
MNEKKAVFIVLEHVFCSERLLVYYLQKEEEEATSFLNKICRYMAINDKGSFVLAVLGFEFRASHLLGRCSTT